MEQYRPKRVKASLSVEIYAAPFQPPLRMTMDNISSSGLFIRTSLAFHVGEILLISKANPFAILATATRSSVCIISQSLDNCRF
ncbi:MAG: PilZ domain-containing protein [Deltaproteobacteria bacterium]|nr:PilZ domain-containing protein [Deltaproteobacteria bacterium]MBN2674176.1 PilZ domain-containing protein [Deltaproteobacteria bacterium]